MGFLGKHRVPLVVVALGVLVLALAAYRIVRQQAAAIPRRTMEIVVGVTRPVTRDIDLKLSYTADVLPYRQVAIFSKTSGFIKKLGAERGDYTREGQLLAEIDAPELVAAVEQSRAAVATAEANLNVAESNLKSSVANAINQEANLAKARAVAENDDRNATRLSDLASRGLISAMDRDNARTTADSSRASLRAAEAQLEVARSQIDTQKSQVALARANVDRERAGLRIAQTNLDNARIVAPFSGYISARNLDLGAAVSNQAAGTSNSSVGIYVLQDLDLVKIQVEVEERHISLVRVGSVARVLTDAYPNRLFEARATRIVHALDPRSRTLGVEMEIANAGHLLKPGMYARAELIIGHHPGALLVPGEAIVAEGDRSVIFVVRNGVVGRRAVTTGIGEGTLVEVTNGLERDDTVIVEGKELVREGQRVRAEPRRGTT